MHHIIFLNGPPGSGKDTIANILASNIALVKEFKFADILYQMASAIIVGNNRERFKAATLSNGKTGRDFLISLSEDLIKPYFGRDFFGAATAGDILILAEYMHPDPIIAVVSDAGFQYEVDACLNRLQQHGEWKSIILQVNRPGHSFKGDSREYIGPPTYFIFS